LSYPAKSVSSQNSFAGNLYTTAFHIAPFSDVDSADRFVAGQFRQPTGHSQCLSLQRNSVKPLYPAPFRMVQNYVPLPNTDNGMMSTMTMMGTPRSWEKAASRIRITCWTCATHGSKPTKGPSA
jgi:hypothetical protein